MIYKNPCFDGNMTVYKLQKLVGHGFYLYPLVKKTVLSSIVFLPDKNIQLVFKNSFFKEEFYTYGMSMQELNDTLNRVVCRTPFELYDRIEEHAIELHKKNFDVEYIIELDPKMRYGKNFSHFNIIYSFGCKKWIDDMYNKVQK